MSPNPTDLAELPRFLADFTPPPAVLKADYEDFHVEELPLYPASGEGTHTYFLLEKAGLSTMQAVADVARALGVLRRDIGFAGLKDARAVTRQWLSVEHVEPVRLEQLDLPRMQVIDVTRHTNKLRLGHLAGNRFRIRMREVPEQQTDALRGALGRLIGKGVPNYFGQQRFGARGDSWLIGRASLHGELEEALDVLLGRPGALDSPPVREARERYERGDYEGAARQWPGMFRDERRALRMLQAKKGNKRRAFLGIDKRMRQFYISAYQSHLFNQVLALRLPSGLDRLEEGDLAWRHANGAVFRVERLEDEQPRADAQEISPSGPLYGYRMTWPTGEPGRREAALLEAEGLSEDAFRSGLRVKGGRRPLRFPLKDADIRLGADQRGPYLELTFTLPPGCYATALLRELFTVREPGTPGQHAATPAPDELSLDE